MNDDFFVFDGKREAKASDVSARWKKASWPYLLLDTTELTLSINGRKEVIPYFRPSFRHFFEGGWTLSNTDIAYAMNTYLNDSDALARLKETLSSR